MSSTVYLGLGLLLFLLLGVMIIYNKFVLLKNKAHNALSNIDVQLKKRFDLIPVLVDTVKGYMNHEKDLFKEITELRVQAQRNQLSDDESVEINNKLSRVLGKLLINVESYPELKASDNFMHLQRTLTEIEAQISASRRSYNMAVTKLNTSIESFPSNIIANLFRFKKQSLFEATASERKTVDVND